MARSSSNAKKSTRTEAVRSAVDQAVQVAAEQGVRFREALDDLRPPSGEELKAVRRKLDALERRVAALEKPKAAKPAKAPVKSAPGRKTARSTGSRTKSS